VTFTLKREQLEFVGADLTPTVEPGEFDVFIAPSAETGVEGRFRLTR
jgi:beta-glucosidase